MYNSCTPVVTDSDNIMIAMTYQFARLYEFNFYSQLLTKLHACSYALAMTQLYFMFLI